MSMLPNIGDFEALVAFDLGVPDILEDDPIDLRRGFVFCSGRLF